MPTQQSRDNSANESAAHDGVSPVAIDNPGAESVGGAGPADPAPDLAALQKKVEDEAAIHKTQRTGWLGYPIHGSPHFACGAVVG